MKFTWKENHLPNKHAHYIRRCFYPIWLEKSNLSYS